ncbi:isochorismate synthase DhbC [Paenibacillus taichungensis]|uniref:isochorismate synthase DhbC n=1 Tax=Paenibacillus taichungensis TaxID=484184 RepID=UPI002871D756|nr:isochorismate synthase DhbC [Paenibacillus taichungensis]MDR9748081.1 isochorismate synthase DhbC [Paenibacillus taichungensis]
MSKAGTVAATSALHLLEQYREGTSFFWSSPQHTLLAQGGQIRWSAMEVSEENTTDFMGAVNGTEQKRNEETQLFINQMEQLMEKARRSGQTKPIVVGAIPFDPIHSSAELFVPEKIQWAEPLSPDSRAAVEKRPAAVGCEVREEPAGAIFQQSVNNVLRDLNQGVLHKVVLSRTLHVTSQSLVNTHQLLRNLFRDNTHGYTFAVPMTKLSLVKGNITTNKRADVETEKETHRTYIGASPELLVTRKGSKVRANPLAGSAARSDDPAEDRRRAEALLASAKDRHEHAVVIEAVAEALRPLCKQLSVPAEPSLIQTRTMWHLSTEIHGELANVNTSSLELAFALHPTPAICGTPVQAARDAIREQEPFERGLFTGMVGWCDSEGDGEWAVTIRCAEVEGNTLKLFAGAGIVAGSTAEAELAETSAKFGTMLLAMGLDSSVSSVKEE